MDINLLIIGITNCMRHTSVQCQFKHSVKAPPLTSTDRWKIKGWRRHPVQTVSRKADVSILTPGKEGFKTRRCTQDKEESFSMIKVSIHQEDITILNMHAFNNRNSST